MKLRIVRVKRLDDSLSVYIESDSNPGRREYAIMLNKSKFLNSLCGISFKTFLTIDEYFAISDGTIRLEIESCIDMGIHILVELRIVRDFDEKFDEEFEI